MHARMYMYTHCSCHGMCCRSKIQPRGGEMSYDCYLDWFHTRQAGPDTVTPPVVKRISECLQLSTSPEDVPIGL
jgi:hypothetical protein